MYDYDIGILGGGAAGLTVAAGAAQFGAKTLLIEKADKLGGDCLHYGCVPSKTLIRTAGVWAEARRAAEFGLPELRLPPVDLGAVMDRVHAVIARIQEHDSPERFCGLGAETRFGAARFVDDHSVELDGARLSAKNWVIATGSRPALPPVEGLDRVAYWTNETVFSQRRLPARLLVLGGGAIGLEMAQAFRRLGSEVTVVEFLDQILGPEDSDVAALLRERLEAEGVEVRLLEEHFADNDRALAEGAPEGKIKVLLDPKGKVVGCQIIGAHAGGLIHEWVAALNGGVKLSTLAGAIHAYPTLSEISKRAAGKYFSEKLFSDRTKSVLRFLFHLKGRACAAQAGSGE